MIAIFFQGFIQLKFCNSNNLQKNNINIFTK